MLAFLTSTSTIASGGLLIIFLLQVAQSCCIPTSSELTLAFAGVLAYEGHLNLAEVIAVGVAGELVGAVIAWAIGKTGGRAFVGRYGRFVLLTRTDLDRAEAWYGRHRRGGVFIGRLIPVIRNFVAIVAGVAEVPFAPFVIFTFLGSAIWDAAWASIGYGVGHNYKTITKDFTDAGYVIAVLVIIAIVFVFAHRWRTYKHLRAQEDREAALADAAGGGTVGSAGGGTVGSAGGGTVGSAGGGTVGSAGGGTVGSAGGSRRADPVGRHAVAGQDRPDPAGGTHRPQHRKR